VRLALNFCFLNWPVCELAPLKGAPNPPTAQTQGCWRVARKAIRQLANCAISGSYGVSADAARDGSASLANMPANCQGFRQLPPTENRGSESSLEKRGCPATAKTRGRGVGGVKSSTQSPSDLSQGAYVKPRISRQILGQSKEE